MNYYNEFNHEAAEWLRELIRAGIIPTGHVDERSISDVQPKDLDGFTQCHFFAGIGGWPFALALAGWDSARPVWTGSCPCQPFSVAGKRKGTSDERHLWPEMHRLIRECKPATVFGEQVAGPDALRWFDGVSADLEASGYACGAADLCAASVGAPHIRQRLYWVADTGDIEQRRVSSSQRQKVSPAGSSCKISRVADMPGAGSQGSELESEGYTGKAVERGCAASGLVQSDGAGCEPGIIATEAARHGSSVESTGSNGGLGNSESIDQRRQRINQASDGRQSATRGSGAWSNYDVIQCLDGKARRVESGTFPLAHGVSGRVGLLRGYGNAIVPQVAAEFVMAFMEINPNP